MRGLVSCGYEAREFKPRPAPIGCRTRIEGKLWEPPRCAILSSGCVFPFWSSSFLCKSQSMPDTCEGGRTEDSGSSNVILRALPRSLLRPPAVARACLRTSLRLTGSARSSTLVIVTNVRGLALCASEDLIACWRGTRSVRGILTTAALVASRQSQTAKVERRRQPICNGCLVSRSVCRV